MESQIITSQNNLEQLPRALFNKHHLLYPKRMWQMAGRDALYLRGEFIVRMPFNVHTALHEYVDPLIGDEFDCSLPVHSTFAALADSYERHKYELSTLGAIEKLAWLDGRLEYRFSNSWLRRLIQYEIEFLTEHAEEIP